MEMYHTPLLTPKRKSRRKAISPQFKLPTSSEPDVVELELGLCESTEVHKWKSQIMEKDNIIGELQAEIVKLKKEKIVDNVTDGTFIEYSTDIHAKVDRFDVHNENDVDSLKIHKIGEERSSVADHIRFKEKDLSKWKSLVAELEEKVKELKDEIKGLEHTIVEKDHNTFLLGLELNEAKIIHKTKVESLEMELDKCREQMTTERVRNNELCREITVLKKALDEFRTDLKKQIDQTKEEEDFLTKKGVKLGDILQKIGSLSAKNDFLEERLAEGKDKECLLLKDLETAKFELRDLQKKFNDFEESAERTHKYLRDEADKVKQQKADIRCEMMELRRECDRLRASSKSEDVTHIDYQPNELETLENQRNTLEKNNIRLSSEISELRGKINKMEQELELKNDKINARETKLMQLMNTVEILDTGYEKLKKHKEKAENELKIAQKQLSEIEVKYQESCQELEKYSELQTEIEHMKADRKRLDLKIALLNDELRETHNDYRNELAQMARQISETRHKDASDNEDYSNKIEKLMVQISDQSNKLHSCNQKIEELQRDNLKLQENVSEGIVHERSSIEENAKLRKGLADAVCKIEQYRKDAEVAKELNQEMAEQLGNKEEDNARLEEEVMDLRESLEEKERLVTYLRSQINVKQMPKLSRRSTLLRTISDTSLEMIDPVQVEELENEKTNLLKQLADKRRELHSRKEMPPLVLSKPQLPSAALDTPEFISQSNSDSNVPSLHIGKNKGQNGIQGTMKHDIPHRWVELRHFGIFSTKCAVCFVGVPTFGKKRRCVYCHVIVHSQCALRVVNTCGLPDKCANYYLDSHSAPNGKMNGWVRLFSDDQSVHEWKSVWGEMDEKRLVFYDSSSTGSESKPFIDIDLEKEPWVVRAGSEIPNKETGQFEQTNSIIHIKMEKRNIYLITPSAETAVRWAEALHTATTRRMMLTRRPSSFSDRSCILVLPAPNNLTIHTLSVIDDVLLIGAQSGLFFTQINNPRVPINMGGISAVSAIECMPDINMIALVVGDARSLAFIPLTTLKNEMSSRYPNVRPDIISGFSRLHILMYHQNDGQRYLCATDTTTIHLLKYNTSKDVFCAYRSIGTVEPAVCLQNSALGFYFGADSFYFVKLGKDELVAHSLAPSHVADYPIAILLISEDEVLLAYQNYGMFVNSRGEQTRNMTVEWEQMPMEFAYTAPFLYVVHYDSIEIMQIVESPSSQSRPILDEREVFECKNGHIVCHRPNGDVFMSVSNKDSVEIHRFNATISKRSSIKRKGISMSVFNDKRSRLHTESKAL